MAKKEQTFVLVSLEEDQAKQLAQVISNDTCRKILDQLAKNKATETELAEYVNIPLSTAHYNLSALVKAGLVVAEEFHYSQKGREVNHYSLAHKYVIIAPSSVSSGIKEKLKSLLLSFCVVAFGGVAVQWISTTYTSSLQSVALMQEKGVAATQSLAMRASETAAFAEAIAPGIAVEPFKYTWLSALLQNKVFYVVSGAALLMIVYLIVEWIRKKVKH